MAPQKITVTEFSKGLSDFLNLVQYRGFVFDIERGKRVVAQIIPVAPMDGFPLTQLADLLQSVPSITASDRLNFARDLSSVRGSLKTKTDPWV